MYVIISSSGPSTFQRKKENTGKREVNKTKNKTNKTEINKWKTNEQRKNRRLQNVQGTQFIRSTSVIKATCSYVTKERGRRNEFFYPFPSETYRSMINGNLTVGVFNAQHVDYRHIWAM